MAYGSGLRGTSVKFTTPAVNWLALKSYWFLMLSSIYGGP